MIKEKLRFFTIIFIFITICFVLSSSQIVTADGGIFVDFGEHVYLPAQKAAIFWDGTNETMVISTKINSSNISNMAWVTPIQSYNAPQVSEGDAEIFNDIAYSFAEYAGGGMSGNEIFFLFFILCVVGVVILICILFLKKIRLSYFFIILFVLLICASYTFLLYIYSLGMIAGSSYENVELIEMKTVDIYDVAILKATDAEDLIQWLENYKFNVPEKSIPVIQEYCNQKDFYFIVNKININNSVDLFTPIYLDVEKKVSNITSFYEDLTKSNIYYFRYDDSYSYGHFCKNPYLDLKKIALEIIDKSSYTSLSPIYVKDLELIGISNEEYNSLVIKYMRDKNLFQTLYWPYTSWLERSIEADLTILWNENGIQKEFKIPNKYSSDTETLILEDILECKKYGICFLNNTIMKFLNDSAPKAQDCYQELKNKLMISNNFILCTEIYDSINNVISLIADFTDQQTYEVDIEFNENNLLDGTILNEIFSYCINTRNQSILNKLREGIATPLEIVFQPMVPMFPMKMSSINEGNTKINVYFISNYNVKDSSELLAVSGKSDFTGNPYISNYNEEYYITWLNYEGNTKDLTDDSYFIEN